MATIIPLAKHLSKTAQLVNTLEEQTAYAEGLARRYGGFTVGEGVNCSAVQVALNQDELLRIVGADSVRSVMGADVTRALLVDGLESACGLTADKLEAGKWSMLTGLSADSLSDYNRALLDSLQPALDWGASTRAAIESMYTPFSQVAESVQRSILNATTPSADILAALQASIKPSAADFEAMFGPADYLAELTQGTSPWAQADYNWRDAPLVPSRQKPRAIVRIERGKPLTRAELEDLLDQHEARLLAKLQGQIQVETRQTGIVVAPALPTKPPIPGTDGYTLDDVFDWFFRAPKHLCFTWEELAPMVGLSAGYLRRKFLEYKEQYGRLPLPPDKSRFN